MWNKLVTLSFVSAKLNTPIITMKMTNTTLVPGKTSCDKLNSGRALNELGQLPSLRERKRSPPAETKISTAATQTKFILKQVENYFIKTKTYF